MMHWFRKIHKDSRGASLVECGVLVALITVTTAAGVKYTGTMTGDKFWSLGACELGGGSECTHDLSDLDTNTLEGGFGDGNPLV